MSTLWTAEADATLLRMAAEGRRFPEIGAALGCTGVAARQRLVRMRRAGMEGVPGVREYLAWTPEMDATVLRLRAEGRNARVIGQQLGLDRDAVLRRVKALRHEGVDVALPARPVLIETADGSRKGYTADDDTLILRRLEEGRTHPQIAAEMGRTLLSLGTRIRKLRKRQAEGKPVGPMLRWEGGWTEAQVTRLLAMRAEGKSAVEIGTEFGRSPVSVNSKLAKLRQSGVTVPTFNRRRPKPRPVLTRKVEAAPRPKDIRAETAPRPTRRSIPVAATPEGAGLPFGWALREGTAQHLRASVAAHLAALSAGPDDLALIETAVTVGGLDATEADRFRALCRPIQRRVKVYKGGQPAYRLVNCTEGQAALVALLRERVAA